METSPTKYRFHISALHDTWIGVVDGDRRSETRNGGIFWVLEIIKISSLKQYIFLAILRKLDLIWKRRNSACSIRWLREIADALWHWRCCVSLYCIYNVALDEVKSKEWKTTFMRYMTSRRLEWSFCVCWKLCYHEMQFDKWSCWKSSFFTYFFIGFHQNSV